MKHILAITALLLATAFVFTIGCDTGDGDDSTTKSAYAFPTRLVVTPTLQDDVGYYLYAINYLSGTMTVMNVRDNKNRIILREGNKLKSDNFPDVGDFPVALAATPLGERIFVCNAQGQKMWVMESPEFTTRSLDIEVGPCEMILAGDLIVIADLPSQRLLHLNLDTEEIATEAQLGNRPRALAVSPDGQTLYLTTDDLDIAAYSVSDLSLQAGPVFLDGDPTRISVSPDGETLFVVNRSPNLLHRLNADDFSQQAPPLELPSAPKDVIFTPEGLWAYIDADNGYVYVYDRESGRICNSSATTPVFEDKGSISNPVIEEVIVTDCQVREEDWTVKYDLAEREWVVRGEKSGKQANRAQMDSTYVSDDGRLQFTILSGDRAPSDEDQFKFETAPGIEPIRVGVMPDDMVIVPDFNADDEYDDDEEYYRVWVANTLSDNLNEITTDEHENEGSFD